MAATRSVGCRGWSPTCRWPTSPSGWSATTRPMLDGSTSPPAPTPSLSPPTLGRCTPRSSSACPGCGRSSTPASNAALGRRPREAGQVRRGRGAGQRDQGGRTGPARPPRNSRRRGTSSTPSPSRPCAARRARRGARRHHRRRPHPPGAPRVVPAIGVPLSEIYGMSETAGPVTWDAYRIKPARSGRPSPARGAPGRRRRGALPGRQRVPGLPQRPARRRPRR